MQPIQLTEEHKAKLLEMCKVLFPEYKISLEIENNYEGTEGFICFQDLSMSKIGDYIHWFEFCMTYLPIELFRALNMAKGGNNLEVVTNNLIRFEDFGRYEINPIDYLYEQFKKLNVQICKDPECFCGKYKKGDLMVNCDGGCMYPGA